MSELYLSQASLQDLATQLELPVDIKYRNGLLIITGAYQLLGERRFQVDLSFEKIQSSNIILKIVETMPSLKIIGSGIKRFLLNVSQQSGLLPESATNAMTIDYPYVVIHGEEIQPIHQALEYCTVEGVDFEPEGIRLRFQFIRSTDHMTTTDTA